MKRALSSLKNWIDSDRSGFIRTLLLSEGFGFCLCISFIWGYRLDRYGTVSGWLIPSILLSLLLGDIVADILMFILLYKRERVQDPTDDARTGTYHHAAPRIWIIASCVIILCWIPVWMAYYPAVFAYDAEAQLGQVISGQYSTHHPLLHTLIMGGCMKLMWSAGGINAGMALYAVLQLMFMGVTGGWTIAEAQGLGAPKWALCVYGAFLAFFPACGILAVSTTKDVIFAGVLLISALLVRRLMNDGGTSSRSDCFKAGIAVAFLILFRNNAVYALIPAILIAMIGLRGDKAKRRAVVLTLVIGCLTGCLAGGGLKAVLHADSGSPREALSVPIQQMARGYVLHRDELPEELRTDLELCLGGDVSDIYDPHISDPVKKQVYIKDIKRFVKTWFKICARYPGDSFDAWLYTTEGAWYVGDTSSACIYGTGSGFGYLNTDTRSMPYGFEVQPKSLIPGLRGILDDIVTNNTYQRIPVIRYLFAPALYVWILITYLYICLADRNRRGIMSLLVPGLVYLTILGGPAVLVRYMYPYMLLLILPFIPDPESEER